MGANHVLFKDRLHAGVLTSEKLAAYRGQNVLILGLSRGGVVTAAAVATALDLPMDVLVVKKLSSPQNTELAIGAVAPDNVSLIHWSLAHRMGFDEEYMKHAVGSLSKEIHRQEREFRKGKKPLFLEGKTVILVDDGMATGATMEVAVKWAQKKRARMIVVAVPVASREAARKLRPEVKEVVVHTEATDLTSVGGYYESFPQITDKEVVELLRST